MTPVRKPISPWTGRSPFSRAIFSTGSGMITASANSAAETTASSTAAPMTSCSMPTIAMKNTSDSNSRCRDAALLVQYETSQSTAAIAMKPYGKGLERQKSTLSRNSHAVPSPTAAIVSGPERSAAAATAVPAHQVSTASVSSPERWYIWPISAMEPPKAAAAISHAASPIAGWSLSFSTAPPT